LPLPLSAQEIPPVATRGETIAFLQLFAGDWRGRGEARAAFEDPLEDGVCSMTAAFDAATATLNTDGYCASTIGRISLDGSLSVLANGSLSGDFFNRFGRAQLLSSSGQLTNDRLVLRAVYQAEIRRQVQTITVTLSLERPVTLTQARSAFGTTIPAGTPTFGMTIEVLDPATGQPVVFSQTVFGARS
jgi:hypothetical protein